MNIKTCEDFIINDFTHDRYHKTWVNFYPCSLLLFRSSLFLFQRIPTLWRYTLLDLLSNRYEFLPSVFLRFIATYSNMSQLFHLQTFMIYAQCLGCVGFGLK